MKPYYEEKGITIYHGDCREVLPQLPSDAAIVSDPPYGMDCDVDTTRFSGGSPESQKRRGYGRSDAMPVFGDKDPFDPAPWLSFPQVILWGFNHFAANLPVGTALVWIKRFDGGFGSFLSDAELAWKKGGHGVYCRRDTSLMGETNVRLHPTQKPLGLMRWCIGFTESPLIIDPYAGSGTTLEAAKLEARSAIGIEIEERYCEIAANRLRQGVLDLA